MAVVSYVCLVSFGIFVAYLAFMILAKALFDSARGVLWVWGRLRRGQDTSRRIG